MLLAISVVGLVAEIWIERKIALNQLQDDIWYGIYIFLIAGSILTAILRKVIDRDYYVTVISSLVVVFLPALVEGYFADTNLGVTNSQLEIILNVQSTMVSCANIVIMFSVTFFILGHHAIKGDKADTNWWILGYQAGLFGIALWAIVWGSHKYESFVEPLNYDLKTAKYIDYISPPTVWCPMNWFRIVIATASVWSLFFPWNNGKKGKELSPATS